MLDHTTVYQVNITYNVFFIIKFVVAINGSVQKRLKLCRQCSWASFALCNQYTDCGLPTLLSIRVLTSFGSYRKPSHCFPIKHLLPLKSCYCRVYPKKYAHGFCFAVLCCGYTLTDFPISIRLTSLALWQSNDCPSASKATLMNMDKYFMWIHYERLHNHNKAKHNKTVCIFHGIYCRML